MNRKARSPRRRGGRADDVNNVGSIRLSCRHLLPLLLCARCATAVQIPGHTVGREPRLPYEAVRAGKNNNPRPGDAGGRAFLRGPGHSGRLRRAAASAARPSTTILNHWITSFPKALPSRRGVVSRRRAAFPRAVARGSSPGAPRRPGRRALPGRLRSWFSRLGPPRWSRYTKYRPETRATQHSSQKLRARFVRVCPDSGPCRPGDGQRSSSSNAPLAACSSRYFWNSAVL